MSEAICTIIDDEFAVVPENMFTASSGEDGVVDELAEQQ